MEHQWPTLVATLSEQAVESSTLVLRALDFLVGAGRLRLAEARALSDALYRMRDTSLRAQQITRLASGRIHQARDRVELADLIGELLESRREEFAVAGVQVRGELQPVDVLLDPPVAVSLVSNALDWALSFSKEVTVCLEAPVWPAPATLVLRVTTPPRRPVAASGEKTSAWGTKQRGRRINDGLHWMFLRQIAASAGVRIVRTGVEGTAILTFEFPKTFQTADGLASIEIFGEDSPASASLLNAWVLVVAPEPALRSSAGEALLRVGLAAQAVASIDEARSLVRVNTPQVIVVMTEAMSGEFKDFFEQTLGPDCRIPVVEITERSATTTQLGAQGAVTLSRQQLKKDLGPTVLFELAKTAFR